MAKPNDTPTRPEQTNLAPPAAPVAPPKPKAPIHHAIHCREDENGDFVVVDVAYSTDAPAKESVIFRHASSAIAIGAMQREVNLVKASLIHPGRFASPAAVAPTQI